MTRRRMRIPQYGRPRPEFSVLHQKMEIQASTEMEAYDQLPLPLKEFLRTSNVGWKSERVMEYWGRLGWDTDATLQLLRGVEEQCFRENQSPTGQVTIQIRRS